MARKKGQNRSGSKKKPLGKYKSGLEADAAKLLRSSGLDFDYEGVEFELMPAFTYYGEYHKFTAKSKSLVNRTGKKQFSINYTPDFVAKDGSWIIETKGYVHQRHDFPMRWKLFMNLLQSKEEDKPMLFICRNKSQVAEAIEIIKNNAKFKQSI